jgi:hypothetical protein
VAAFFVAEKLKNKWFGRAARTFGAAVGLCAPVLPFPSGNGGTSAAMRFAEG